MKAVFWDNDGVLVDTEHFYFEESRAALRELGLDISEEEYVEISLGRGASAFEVAERRGISSAEIEAARERRNVRYSARLANLELLPGVRETLAALHGRVKMAVVTSSRPEHFALQHESTGALRYFDFVLTQADYVNHKPDPEPYLMAAARAGVNPSDCLVIEDTERGLIAARSAGMHCAVIPRGLSARGNFASATRVLERADHILALIDELRGRE
jgi:HAD superfamily hydrolase (TIGR01509 family)